MQLKQTFFHSNSNPLYRLWRYPAWLKNRIHRPRWLFRYSVDSILCARNRSTPLHRPEKRAQRPVLDGERGIRYQRDCRVAHHLFQHHVLFPYVIHILSITRHGGFEKGLYGFEDDIMLTKLYLMGKHSIRLPNHQIDNELQQRYTSRRAGFNNYVVVCTCTQEVSRSETERVVS